ncbi:hypothetical protein HOD96_03405 [Candidatus Falkowbacteria bacterium]|nr:hypothetical protein [Candidatus Falkowbacteria bacterium]MBT4432975.1 hypothetical protein [Candidatus Falkowbacteria bacterium]
MFKTTTNHKPQITNHNGFSLIEVLLAGSIFALAVTALVGAFIFGQESTMQAGVRSRAVFLIEEEAEALRSIRDGAWNELTYTQSAVEISDNKWIFSGEGTDETVGDYTRSIIFEDVCRDSSHDIVSCPGDYTDEQSKKATIEVTWTEAKVGSQSISQEIYLTNWDSRHFEQTNWVGGSGQSTWSDSTRYLSDNGNIDVSTTGAIKLNSIEEEECATNTWSFNDGGNYTFDSNDIEVTGGVAQLKSAEETQSGQTVNSAFNTSSNWTSGNWAYSSGDYVNNQRMSSNGNPSYWVYSHIRLNNNDTAGGYWQQSFVTTVDNPDIVTLEFDYQPYYLTVSPGDRAWFYVFVETTSGAPSSIGNAIWSHEFTGSDSRMVWVEDISVDASSKVGAAGTYYVKMAMWFDTAYVAPDAYGNVPDRYTLGGYDNVTLSWSNTSSSYPIDEPSINPNNSYEPSSIDSWAGFSETATKNGGEIYYQLSDGSGWKYWNGSSWTTAGASDYNTVSVVNSNISEFSAATQSIMFKAFLESNGTQLVKLDDISIECDASESGGGGYVTSGELISSAYDAGATSRAVQSIEWDEIIPSCSPACDVTFQIKSATTEGGLSSASWSSSYTDPDGNILSTSHNANRWLQYKTILTGDGTETPTLEEIRLNYK